MLLYQLPFFDFGNKLLFKTEKFLPSDCLEIKEKYDSSRDGVYNIYLDSKKEIKVYCAMKQGGWTVSYFNTILIYTYIL